MTEAHFRRAPSNRFEHGEWQQSGPVPRRGKFLDLAKYKLCVCVHVRAEQCWSQDLWQSVSGGNSASRTTEGINSRRVATMKTAASGAGFLFFLPRTFFASVS